MSKTFFYLIVTMAIFIGIINPLNATDNTKNNKNNSDKEDGKNKNGVSQGAKGQIQYRIGYTK